MNLFRSTLVLTVALVLTLGAAEPSAELATFSSFESVDLRQLAKGEILARRGSLMDFSRGISTETCFLVPAPMQATLETLQTWNPTSHASLEVSIHRGIQSPPQDADFEALRLQTSNNSQQWLVEKTFAAGKGRPDIHLSAEDLAALGSISKPSARDAQEREAETFWKGVLKQRAVRFQKGGIAALPAYRRGAEEVHPLDEARSLLAEEMSLAQHFGSLLRQTGLSGEAPSGLSQPSQGYWELSKISDHATLTLGAVFTRPSGPSVQVLDCQYFATGSYYLSLTLYELWPVTVDGREATLVWRGDLFSAPSLAVTRGTERLAYGAIMLQEIKKTIRFFREDVTRSGK